MAGTTALTIGADVSCTDGICGKVSRLVIDLRARTVTHLVVDDRSTSGGSGHARLWPSSR